MKRPIAMRCTPEQWEAIKPKLEKVGVLITSIHDFKLFPYLSNDFAGTQYVFDEIHIGNFDSIIPSLYNKGCEFHETWNEAIFLDACGIVEKTLDSYIQELKEFAAKEGISVDVLVNKPEPKAGDVCRVWDVDDAGLIYFGILDSVDYHSIYRFKCLKASCFKHAETITDTAILKYFGR